MIFTDVKTYFILPTSILTSLFSSHVNFCQNMFNLMSLMILHFSGN